MARCQRARLLTVTVSNDPVVRAHVLGAVHVSTHLGERIVPRSVSQRRLLAMLALHSPRPLRAEWLAEEKTLKTQIKQAAAALHLKTKTTIEGLSDAQVNELLERKWIIPFCDSLHRLPGQQVDGLIFKLEALVEKYRITYADNAGEIRQAESELVSMIEDLEANEFDRKGLAKLKSLLAGK